MSILNNIKISQRIDTFENWSAANPILNNGELVIVVFTDNNVNVKVGNGTLHFNNLKFLYADNFSSKSISADQIYATSIAQGTKTSATPTSMATGIYTEVSANYGVVHGIEAKILSGDDYAFVFNGTNLPGIDQRYTSHGEGTFNINPTNGLSGLYVGEETMSQILSAAIPLSTSELINDSNFLSTISIATISSLGGIKLGYSQTGNNYPISLDANNKAYVNVPWTDKVVSSVIYDAATTQLIIKFNDIAMSEISCNIGDLVDLYAASNNGIHVNDSVFSLEYSEISSGIGLSNYTATTDQQAIDAAILASIPLSTSELINDSNFLTSYQSYATISTGIGLSEYALSNEMKNNDIYLSSQISSNTTAIADKSTVILRLWT